MKDWLSLPQYTKQLRFDLTSSHLWVYDSREFLGASKLNGVAAWGIQVSCGNVPFLWVRQTDEAFANLFPLTMPREDWFKDTDKKKYLQDQWLKVQVNGVWMPLLLLGLNN